MGLAEIMGCSPQNVFTYFQRDDMKLSIAQDVAGKLGYDLSFSLERENVSTSNVIVEIEPLVGTGGLKRLAFLRVAMSLYGIKRADVAEKLGITLSGVNRWFKVDDISVSYIFKIAALYDLKVKVSVTPLKD